jgi:hypothetical protein
MKKKYVQFVVIFHLLGPWLILRFKLKDLYTLPEIKRIPKDHWIDFFGWYMVKNMWDVFIISLKETMTFINLIIISANEVNMVYNS